MWVWTFTSFAHAIPVGPIDPGVIDPGVDADGDGYNELVDCDDFDASIHPGAFEGIGDGLDSSCDGDETCYRDNDDDGGRSGTTIHSSDLDCTDAFESYYWDPVDCNDNNSGIGPLIYDGAGDGIDSNCDGQELCYSDEDNDGATGSARH